MNYGFKLFSLLTLFLVPITMQAMKIADLPSDRWTIGMVKKEGRATVYQLKHGDSFLCTISALQSQTDSSRFTVALAQFKGASSDTIAPIIQKENVYLKLRQKDSSFTASENQGRFSVPSYTGSDLQDAVKQCVISMLTTCDEAGKLRAEIKKTLEDAQLRAKAAAQPDYQKSQIEECLKIAEESLSTLLLKITRDRTVKSIEEKINEMVLRKVYRRYILVTVLGAVAGIGVLAACLYCFKSKPEEREAETA